VVYAGTGGFSSNVGSNGFAVGLLRSTDGGLTWKVLAPDALAGTEITRVLPLDNTSNNPNAQTVLVATTGSARGGIYRSVDSGVTFTRLLEGNTTDILIDPAVPNRIYAGVSGGDHRGVVRSDDGGATWHDINTGFDVLRGDGMDNNGDGFLDADDGGENQLGAGRIVLAIQQNAGAPSTGATSNIVYAALISDDPRGHFMGLFQSRATGTGAAFAQSDWALVGPAGAKPPVPPKPELNYAAVQRDDNTLRATRVNFVQATSIIHRNHGGWRLDGFAVSQIITVVGASNAKNNNDFVISAISADDLDLTVTGPWALPVATPLADNANQPVGPTGVRITGRADVPLAQDTYLSDATRQPQPSLGQQGILHFAVVADALGNVFISGDTALFDSTGNAYSFNVGTQTWTSIAAQTLAGAPTRPHADTRSLLLDATAKAGSATLNAGALYSMNDGGLHRFNLATRAWESLNADSAEPTGALRTGEVLAVAYDPLNGILFAGSQDNGSFEQRDGAGDGVDNDLNGQIDDPAEQFSWTGTLGGDGQTQVAVPIDMDRDGVLDRVIHFVVGNNLQFFTERIWDAAGGSIQGFPTLGKRITSAGVPMTVNTGTEVFTTVSTHDFPYRTDIPYHITTTGASLPGGTFAEVPYFLVLEANHSQLTLRKFAPTGPAVDVTSAGSGTIKLVPVLLGAQGGVLKFDLDRFASDNSGFQTIPIVDNAVEHNRMLIGLCNLYESSDYLTSVTKIGPTQSALCYSALEYGGQKDGHDRWEVVYAAKGGKVYIRLPQSPTSATINAFKTETIPGAFSIRDLALDPLDYTQAYAATDAGVFKRVGTTWKLVSQNLINANYRSIEFISSGVAGHGTLLVGTTLGVLRAFVPAPNVG